MKNKIRTLLIASMCMAMATTAIPTSFNPLATTTVEAATTEKNGLYHEGSNWIKILPLCYAIKIRSWCF